ncbi:MAG: DNA mismatch repair endonuclease MutL [Lachnospiraceae bacterium]|nr:DNA mismatch repair endonuclease MutL [Lachnospiraceae bacterium]
MAVINRLDQETINQIAAGEVVERPASVVKELLENSVDAGATAVTVEVKEGGIGMIRITDNGSGIEQDQIRIAFLRHTTSKIQNASDLLSLKSLGFRGEALSSICAVSQVELLTKTRSALSGSRYLIEGGQEKALQDIGCPDGTTFLIRNLFYNTPARRKFLKSPMTEAGYINDLVERIAVSHPEVSFKFINNGKLLVHTSGNRNLKDILYHIYGRDIAAQLVEVQYEEGGVAVTGYAAKPVVSRGNRNYENYYINGRYIKSSVLTRAIEDAYKPYTMTHKYPFTALHYTMDTASLDVNVHPTKMEVRFGDPDLMYRVTSKALAQALSGKSMIPHAVIGTNKNTGKVEKSERAGLAADVPEPFEKKRLEREREAARVEFCRKPVPAAAKDTEIGSLHDMAAFPHPHFEELVRERAEYGRKSPNEGSGENKGSAVSAPDSVPVTPEGRQSKLLNWRREAAEKARQQEEKRAAAEEKQTAAEEKQPAAEKKNIQTKQLSLFGDGERTQAPVQGGDYRIIGQLFSTYWLVEIADELYIIDQHAAHEKILYERTMKTIEKKEFLSQIVSPPIIMTLTLREEAALKEHMDILQRIGFEIEPFGGREYSVTAVPADQFGIAGEALLRELIDSLVEESLKGPADIVLEKIASLSCKAAVKGNHTLSEEEARALIADLLTLENPYHCPHGRPIIISMSKYEIEKKFKRIV